MFGQSGGTNFYALGPVFVAWNFGEDWKALIDMRLRQPSQNENPTDFLKMRTPVSQNEKAGGLKMRNRGSQNEKHEYKDIEFQIDTDVERGRARQKNTPTDFRKRHTSMPSSGPAPHLFSESVWVLETAEAWRVALVTETSIEDLNGVWYFNRVKDWSAEKAAKSANWIATAAKFVRDDQRKNKLVTINNATDDTARHTILVNPITGNTTNLQRVTDATKAARRVMEKWAKAS